MPRPFISIIIPAYNSEKYIGQALTSCTNQTNSDFEVIIINDGSTDNTKKVVETHIGTSTRYKLINKSNAGVAAARNAGLKIAKGEYITFLDADDELHENFVLQSKKILGIEKYDCIIYNHSLLKNESSTPHKIPSYTTKISPYIITEKYPSVWAKVFRASIIQEKNISFYNARTLEDVFFTLDFLKQANQFHIDNNALYNYRITPNSLSRKITSNIISEREEIVEHYYRLHMPASKEEQKDHVTFFLARILKQLFVSCGKTMRKKEIKNTFKKSFLFFDKMTSVIKLDLALSANKSITQYINSKKIRNAYRFVLILQKTPLGLRLIIIKMMNYFI